MKDGRAGASIRFPSNGDPGERRRRRSFASYLETPGRQLYCVREEASAPRRGSVLLCGPVGAERERAYPSVVAWSRTLAAHGFDALRFDYSGIGESTGRFEEQSVSTWRTDAERCAASLAESARDVPLVLHGIRLGALIAAELFASGVGDALLLWAPPSSAQELLREALRATLISQRINDPGSPGRTREEQIAALESGELVNVDGYFWSEELWYDAQRHTLVVPSAKDPRPWHVLHTRRLASASAKIEDASHVETVDAEDFWGTTSMEIVPSIEGFFRASLRWLDERGPREARNV